MQKSLFRLKRLEIGDKEKFDNAYSKLKFPLAEHSFAWMYVWDCYNDIEWAEINGNLCLFVTFDGNRCVWNPIIPGNNLSDTIKICYDICESYNKKNNFSKKPRLMYLPEELKDFYSNIQGFKILHQNQDYIYRRQDIIELKGDKYKKKRNMKNFFVVNYKHKVEEYVKEKHMRGCIEVLDKWKAQKLNAVDQKYLKSIKDEYDANIKALDKAEELSFRGIVVFVDGKIQGFSLGEQSNESVVTCFFEKTNLEIKGLSVFIYGEFLKLFGCEYVNAGEDWDIDYLKKVKMSYHPVMIKKSYVVEKE